jgi:hypothetical protein
MKKIGFQVSLLLEEPPTVKRDEIQFYPRWYLTQAPGGGMCMWVDFNERGFRSQKVRRRR